MAPNPPLVCGNAGAAAAPALPNPPVLLPAEEKLNPDADPNPEDPAGLLVEEEAKEKVEAEGWAGAPKPEGVCGVEDPNGAPKTGADVNPNSGRFSGKPKLPVWAGAGEPKSES